MSIILRSTNILYKQVRIIYDKLQIIYKKYILIVFLFSNLSIYAQNYKTHKVKKGETIEQIAKIFSGEIANWSQLGGEDQDIHLFSRDNNSGTWDTFKSLVLNNSYSIYNLRYFI
mgnify:CR=1 FL=1